jgi:pyruvate/2-oxoglutarate dehydrogenase complex dihydrolipoamide dehydrogenase (E3) component
MVSYDYDIGVIGGGAAGLTVAAGAARLGVKTLLVEKEHRLGGDCLHYGCVPSKTLIKTANVYHQIKNSTKYGLPRVDIPPVDFRNVRERIRSVIETIQKHDSVERFCSLGAQVEFGTASFVDEHAIELDGKRISAAKWVVATGSRPSMPSIDGLKETPVLTNMDLFYMESLPEHLIILGAGPIAIEMAQAFVRLGSRVTVIQRSGRIMKNDDEMLTSELRNILEEEGVEFLLGATTRSVRAQGSTRVVEVEQAGRNFAVSGDAILVALGRTVDVEALKLENAGVEYDQDGVAVDRRMRTSQKHIYACGDVTGRYQFTHGAGYEGSIVVSNAVFHLPRKADYTFFPWCTYTAPELANIGKTEETARADGEEVTVWTEELSANDRAQAEGQTRGRIKLVLGSKGNPIGVQILAPGAGDLLAEWVAAMSGKVKLHTLAGAVHPYPTLSELNKFVAGKQVGEKLFSPMVKKGLKFFFGFKGRACGLESDAMEQEERS